MDAPRRMCIGNCSYGDVYKHGFFIKSPPPHLFSNQNSWKRRHFILSKSGKNEYVLRYLKGAHLKGYIEINETSEIEIGIGDPEKMTVVKKMFKCKPAEVMTIRTENRVFYLIGSDSKDVEDWATFLFSTSRETKKPEMRGRSKSSPACLDELAADIIKKELCPGNEYEDIGTSISKKRPSSEPITQESSQEASQEAPVYESLTVLQIQHLTNRQQSEEKSEMEEYYACPKSILAVLNDTQDKFSTTEETTNPDKEKVDEPEEYMSMGCIVSGVAEVKIEPTNNELMTLPEGQEDSMNLQVIENKPLKPTPLPRTWKPEKTPKLSVLSVVQLSIILSKVRDDCKLEEVDILLPRSDFTNCLTLVKAAGRICVSQWKDLHRLGCIFHQGDYIVAVNDLHAKSIDEMSLFITRSTRKEVKLTVCRLPDSKILHAQGCKCS
ncbi:pleckstrin homology domain-containing family S member 1 isoform X1 [Zootoca vivipara]|uniref:pleckstrin homology domain-containing family S member 1 isoform X1 n=1 Tax=Zootoca vivipara TaxID=8524 RepID=UPI00293BBCDD|nr:pleckstrin homology domain-containing family S member 1 isoform X1 [Zootoca vivipara]XP_060130735.1 pleckstrin homology domain-containing family S member 1 isoform X1 [Zootoca vivipara]